MILCSSGDCDGYTSEANRYHIKPCRSRSHSRPAISRGCLNHLWWHICVRPSSPFVSLPRALHMSFPVTNRSTVDLGATVQKNKDTTKTILVMHALTLADAVTATYNVGKQLAREAMEQPTQTICPSLHGDPQADLDQVCSSAMWIRKVCVQGCNLHV